jgi:hypothetical protein
MLSRIQKLAMTHCSISTLDFGSVAVWGEGLAKPFVALGPALLPALWVTTKARRGGVTEPLFILARGCP